jgi:hypothetical protein
LDAALIAIAAVRFLPSPSELATAEFQVFRAVASTPLGARSFLAEPIPEPVLAACFDVAIRAPVATRIWRFLDVRQPERAQR